MDKEHQGKLRGDTGHIVTEWVEMEKVARSVTGAIHATRKGGEGKWCTIDHGWKPIAAIPKRNSGLVVSPPTV
jgi:hypothetical protein